LDFAITKAQAPGKPDEHSLAELFELTGAAHDVMALVEFMGPERVASLARSAVVYRNMFWVTHLEVSPGRNFHKDLQDIRKITSELRDAMRADLGLEAEQRADEGSGPSGGLTGAAGTDNPPPAPH
jgi:hypothetical protein